MAKIEALIFHDERMIPGWLYHGYIICNSHTSVLLGECLRRAKNDASCDASKRIHFSELRSNSQISSRSRTAKAWAKLYVKELYYHVKFYLFGINTDNLDYNKFGPPSDGQLRKYRIYNTFFHIGLFSACRFFFDANSDAVEVAQIYSEDRNLSVDDPFLVHSPYKVNSRESNVSVRCSQITSIASDSQRELHNPEYVDIINFVDVLLGGFSQIMDATSVTARGCNEVAECLYPLCRRLTQNPYNKNSRYYKKCAFSFFPAKNLSHIETNGNTLSEDLFYHKRNMKIYQRCLPGFE
ncbi:MAG: hypothetical protein WC169_00975 [Dehalococcoidia bacterium]|jgi:hypothetical protein